MSQPIMSSTGLPGVIASGNTPTWVVQASEVPTPLTDQSTSFPLDLLTEETTVKADCHMDMDGVAITRTPTTRERKRMCEKVTVTVKTGETIETTITAIYDQQADEEALINAVYDALAEGVEVYIVRAYGLDANVEPTTSNKVDVVRGVVQMRDKNDPVDGEDLMFTSTLATDLYLPDLTLTNGDDDNGGESGE